MNFKPKQRVFLYVIIAFVLGLLFANAKSDLFQKKPVVTGDPVSSTEDVNTFISTKYGFSFKHPANLVLNKESEEKIVLLSDIPGRELRFLVTSEPFEKRLEEAIKSIKTVHVQAPKSIVDRVQKGFKVESYEGQFNIPLELALLKVKSIYTHSGGDNGKCDAYNFLGYSIDGSGYYAHFEEFYFPLQNNKTLKIEWEDNGDPSADTEHFFSPIIDTVGTGILLKDCVK